MFGDVKKTKTNNMESFFLAKKKHTFNNHDGKTKLSKICAFCNKIEETTDSFKICSRCKISIYCSKECQKKHWKAIHKNNCKSDTPLSYNTTYQKHCSMVLQSSLLHNYDLYLNSPISLDSELHTIFNECDNHWYVSDYDEDYFLLERTNEEHFKSMCEKHNWAFISNYWKIYYGECIDGKLLINTHS